MTDSKERRLRDALQPTPDDSRQIAQIALAAVEAPNRAPLWAAMTAGVAGIALLVTVLTRFEVAPREDAGFEGAETVGIEIRSTGSLVLVHDPNRERFTIQGGDRTRDRLRLPGPRILISSKGVRK